LLYIFEVESSIFHVTIQFLPEMQFLLKIREIALVLFDHSFDSDLWSKGLQKDKIEKEKIISYDSSISPRDAVSIIDAKNRISFVWPFFNVVFHHRSVDRWVLGHILNWPIPLTDAAESSRIPHDYTSCKLHRNRPEFRGIGQSTIL
jgi:hypothetical protein